MARDGTHTDASFLVARDPDADSSLRSRLRVPIDGGILLKARDRWSSTTRVCCHHAPECAEAPKEP